jgi:hypothetical protein
MGDVTTRELDWKAAVYKVLGTDRSKPEDAYVFSNGKRIKNTDAKPGGPYSGTSTS